MKKIACIIIQLLSLPVFSQAQQAKPDVVDMIGKGDTIVFTAMSSGCFHHHTHTYTFWKQSNNDRIVCYQKDSALTTYRMAARNYYSFIGLYKRAYHRFNDKPQESTCTSVSKFSLSHADHVVRFVNGKCEAINDPEHILQELLKQ